jgi:phage terminase large subunit
MIGKIVCARQSETGFPVALATCNGAGKTSVVLATAILRFLWNFPKGRCPITSGSWLQLRNQLFQGLRAFSSRPVFKGWTFLDSEIQTPQGGFAIGFSTDEADRAEGWHSRPDSPVMFVIDEAKAVHDKIFEAIARCSVDFKILASSTGAAQGQLYRSFTEERGAWWTLRVPSTMCPHIPDARREADRKKFGEHSYLYRSMHLAEFVDDANMSIITPALVRANMENSPAFVPGSRTAFCDFAAGGDENVIAVRDGNRVFIAAAWRETDTMQAVRQFIAEFERLKLTPGAISGDEGGLGTVMCDALRDAGWRINRVNNGAAAERSNVYANRGAEIWFEAKRLIEERKMILPDDPVFFQQATNRRVEYTANQKLRAESKESMRNRGVASPDRADAIFGAMTCQGFGGITLETLKGIKFGGPGYRMFPSTAVTFGDSRDD